MVERHPLRLLRQIEQPFLILDIGNELSFIVGKVDGVPVAAAAVAAGVAIYKLCTYQTEAEKSASRLNKAYEESQKEEE